MFLSLTITGFPKSEGVGGNVQGGGMATIGNKHSATNICSFRSWWFGLLNSPNEVAE